MNKENKAFRAALEKAETVQDLHRALERLPEPPRPSTTEQPTTLAGLIAELEAEMTAGKPSSQERERLNNTAE